MNDFLFWEARVLLSQAAPILCISPLIKSFLLLPSKMSLDGRETTKQKFKRKFSREPLIPIFGCATVFVLGLGLANFRRGGNAGLSQKLMRARVILQGMTVAAFAGGSMFYNMIYDKELEDIERMEAEARALDDVRL
jgi:hypothetical protein